MITVISLNSAIDQVYQTEGLLLNEGNRIDVAYRGAGGKSINVAKVLNRLGIPVRVYGFKAGGVGELIATELNEKKVAYDFIEVQGSSRFCTTIIDNMHTTELLEPGHIVNEQALELLFEQCKYSAYETTYFVISGSLPQGMTTESYEQFINRLKALHKPIILDTSYAALKIAYASQPFLLKPNEQEFQQLINQTLETKDQFKESLRELTNAPTYLIVSLGKDGALVKHNHLLYEAYGTKNFKIANAVGSGDSFLAGFIAGLYQHQSIKNTLKMAMAAGVANAMRLDIAEIDLQQYKEILPTIVVTEEEV